MAEHDTGADQRDAHWSKTKALMVTTMVIWFVFAFAIHLLADFLNQVMFLGFPLGWYLAAQGSLIVFVALVFWFARRQNSIDAKFGVAEDD